MLDQQDISINYLGVSWPSLWTVRTNYLELVLNFAVLNGIYTVITTRRHPAHAQVSVPILSPWAIVWSVYDIPSISFKVCSTALPGITYPSGWKCKGRVHMNYQYRTVITFAPRVECDISTSTAVGRAVHNLRNKGATHTSIQVFFCVRNFRFQHFCCTKQNKKVLPKSSPRLKRLIGRVTCHVVDIDIVIIVSYRP